ncbi:hypothetical protein Tco_0305056 [Tanacetum coccineum]
MHEMRKNYNNRRGDHASKNDDTPMCEHHEVNYIQSEGYHSRIPHYSYSHQSHHDLNDSKKSLTELNNDVRNDLEDFKRCIHSMRTDYDKLYDRDDRKTTIVLPNKKSKIVKPQPKTNLEKSINKFSDSHKVTSMTDPPPPQDHTEQVNVVFAERGKSDDSLKIQTLPPIIVVDKPIKTSKGNYHMVKTKEYPFREYIPKTPCPQRLNVDHSHLNRIVKVHDMCRGRIQKITRRIEA